MARYDVHVATEGAESPDFRADMESRGFVDDRLLRRTLDYPPFVREGVPPPVIGLHMSKRGDFGLQDVKREMAEMKDLIHRYEQVGYVHAEVAVARTAFEAEGPYRHAEWPLERLEPRFRAEEKKWDLHLAVALDSLPPALQDILQYEVSGFDCLDRIKVRDGVDRPTRIYTVQGVCNPRDGRYLFDVLTDWFRNAHNPVKLKLEATIDMFRVGDPAIVPPTVDSIQYR